MENNEKISHKSDDETYIDADLLKNNIAEMQKISERDPRTAKRREQWLKRMQQQKIKREEHEQVI